MPWSAARVAAAMPGASSRNDNAWATEPPYVSASTRTVGMPSAASSVARVTAMVVGPARRSPDRDHATGPGSTPSDGPPVLAVKSGTASRPFDERAASRIPDPVAGSGSHPPSSSRSRASRVGSAVTGRSVRAASNSASSAFRAPRGRCRAGATAAPTPRLPCAAIPTTCTPADRSWATAVRSRPRRSPETSATVPRPPPPSRRVGQIRAGGGRAHLARGLEEGRDRLSQRLLAP